MLLYMNRRLMNGLTWLASYAQRPLTKDKLLGMHPSISHWPCPCPTHLVCTRHKHWGQNSFGQNYHKCRPHP
jgi:hypothetical protein